MFVNLLCRGVSFWHIKQPRRKGQGLTVERNFENGRPWSRANAHVWRDADARKPKVAQITRVMRIAVMTEAPALLLVAP